MCRSSVVQEAKNFLRKTKGFRDGLSYSTPQKSKGTRGNAITQPRSHPIPKFYIFLMGWDRGFFASCYLSALACMNHRASMMTDLCFSRAYRLINTCSSWEEDSTRDRALYRQLPSDRVTMGLRVSMREGGIVVMLVS